MAEKEIRAGKGFSIRLFILEVGLNNFESLKNNYPTATFN
jgi:hypothetical protein